MVSGPTASEKDGGKNPDRETQSRLHRQVAAANKARDEAIRLADEAEQRARTAEQTIVILKENGATDENVDLASKLAGEQARLQAQRHKIEEQSRVLTIEAMSSQYGIPAEELESYSDPREMRLAAREWAFDHRSEQETGSEAEKPPSKEGQNGKAPPSATQNKKETPPAKSEEPPEENSGFDMGMGILASKSVADMSKEEFEANEARIDGAIAAKASRQR